MRKTNEVHSARSLLYLVDLFALTDIERTVHSHLCARVCVSWYVHRLKTFALKVWLWKCKTVFYFNIELAVISRLIHCCFYTNARNKDTPCHVMAWHAFNMLAVTHTTQYRIIVVDVFVELSLQLINSIITPKKRDMKSRQSTSDRPWFTVIVRHIVQDAFLLIPSMTFGSLEL